MIYVSNTIFDTTQLLQSYSRNSVEQIVLSKMSDSAAAYRYDYEDQLKFELTLRREITVSAKELNRSGFGFAVFNKSECNTQYWNRENNGGFSLKEGVSPTKAISDIFKNGRKYRNECATAMIIVYYGALLSVFRDKFDVTFPYIYLMNWHIIDPLLESTGFPKPVQDILLGDRCYFKNPDVDPETMWWQGENVIVLEDDLYYGHGIGIGTFDYFIKSLNENRKEGATRSAYLMDVAARPDFKLLADVYYGRASVQATLHWRTFPVSA